MVMKKLELLAPAGSFESLKAAVLSGADAVYLGGGKYNARINAGNFSGDDLVRALDYAHERGVKVYITLNTLLKNSELKDALDFLAYARQNGADAVIVQDLGLLRLIKKYIPDIPIHASTQMTASCSATVEALADLGVKRVVLSRELSLSEIKSIYQKTNMELEVFVHGALCVCYSGQCLMSGFIGGRSGNRGLCAQPCRLPWAVSRNNGSYSGYLYLLSTRDLMALDLLPELKDAGVASLKIEGRMKSPEYVAIVTSVYRKYIDLLEQSEKNFTVDEKDREKLLQAFNRGGFTQSYLLSEKSSRKLIYTGHPKNQGIYIGEVLDYRPPYVKIHLSKPLHMGDGIEILDDKKGPISLIVTAIVDNNRHVAQADANTTPWVGDVKAYANKGSKVCRTLSKPLFEEARKTYEHGERALVPLEMRFTLKTGEKARLTATDDMGNTAAAESDVLAEKALNRPLTYERIFQQLNKTGDTPYWLDKLDVDTDNESIIPVSVLNALRRNVLAEIAGKRIARSKKPNNNDYLDAVSVLPGPEHQVKDQTNQELSVYFYDCPKSLEDFDKTAARAYLPVCPADRLKELKAGFGGELYIWTPSVLRDSDLERVINELSEIADLVDGFSFGSLGAFRKLKKAFPQKAFCADFAMNLFNNQALDLNKKLGADTCALSPELNLNEIRSMSCKEVTLEAIVYGRIPVMTMENCPQGAEKECTGQCEKCAGNRGFLKDRKGEIFPYVRDTAIKRTQIFNSVPIFMDDMKLKETPVSLFRLFFTTEDAEVSAAVAKYYYNRLKGSDIDPETLQTIKEIKDRGYTKGHWFRGV